MIAPHGARYAISSLIIAALFAYSCRRLVLGRFGLSIVGVDERRRVRARHNGLRPREHLAALLPSTDSETHRVTDPKTDSCDYACEEREDADSAARGRSHLVVGADSVTVTVSTAASSPPQLAATIVRAAISATPALRYVAVHLGSSSVMGKSWASSGVLSRPVGRFGEGRERPVHAGLSAPVLFRPVPAHMCGNVSRATALPSSC